MGIGTMGITKQPTDANAQAEVADNFEDKDYVGIAQNEWTTTLRSGVGYRFNRNVEAGLALSHKIVDSSAAGADYNETTVEATLTLRR